MAHLSRPTTKPPVRARFVIIQTCDSGSAGSELPQARLEDSGSGLAPASEGWFVVSVRDAEWWTSDGTGKQSRGSRCGFESEEEHEFPQLGICVHVLEPGEPNGLYHAESDQEAFLVLFGECRLLVEGEERLLRQWDFFHSPPGTEHIFVGAGDGPCAILMAGARGSSEDWQALYPVSELAALYGASAQEETSDQKQAYVGFEWFKRERPSYWDRLPWAS
jgi:uncharacterized cupin superfamily protein